MRAFKILRLLLHLFLGVFLTLILAGIFRQSASDPLYRKLKGWWLSYIPRILGIKTTTFGTPVQETVLFVSNHISWLDILLLGGVVNPFFLSKAGVRKWPLVGWLAEKAGTLFIHRGNKSSALKIKQEMTDALSSDSSTKIAQIGNQSMVNTSILFFPEGTTTDGAKIQRFRARLFEAAIDAGVPIQPILLRYPHHRYPTNPSIPFIGKQTALENLWLVLGEKEILAEVYLLKPLYPQDPQGKTARELALECQHKLEIKLKELS